MAYAYINVLQNGRIEEEYIVHKSVRKKEINFSDWIRVNCAFEGKVGKEFHYVDRIFFPPLQICYIGENFFTRSFKYLAFSLNIIKYLKVENQFYFCNKNTRIFYLK